MHEGFDALRTGPTYSYNVVTHLILRKKLTSSPISNNTGANRRIHEGRRREKNGSQVIDGGVVNKIKEVCPKRALLRLWREEGSYSERPNWYQKQEFPHGASICSAPVIYFETPLAEGIPNYACHPGRDDS